MKTLYQNIAHVLGCIALMLVVYLMGANVFLCFLITSGVSVLWEIGQNIYRKERWSKVNNDDLFADAIGIVISLIYLLILNSLK